MKITQILQSRRPRVDYRGLSADALATTMGRAGELEQGADATRGAALQSILDFDPERFLSGEALNDLIEGSVPTLRREMGGLRATHARRGINGPLAGAQEGDLMAAFDRNARTTAANFAGRRADLALGRADLLNQRADGDSELAFATRGQGLELLMGERDLQTAEAQARREERAARRRALGAGVGALVGGAGGFAVGGPGGAATGAQIGGQAGAGFFG